MFSFLVFIFWQHAYYFIVISKGEWLNHLKKNIKKIPKQFLKKSHFILYSNSSLNFFSVYFFFTWLKISRDSDTNISLILTENILVNSWVLAHRMSWFTLKYILFIRVCVRSFVRSYYVNYPRVCVSLN